eukprot:SM005907S19190  [mRNA]  locus=s5907:164:667:- [translate_table: standard]
MASTATTTTSTAIPMGMAPTHAALAPGCAAITAVSFDAGRKGGLGGLAVTGKHKKNAPRLEAESALCRVLLTDGNAYVMR